MEANLCDAKHFVHLHVLGDNIVNLDFVKKTTVKVNRNGSTFSMAPIAHSDAGTFHILAQLSILHLKDLKDIKRKSQDRDT